MGDNNDKVVGYVFETYDYQKFKKLEGNRSVLETRKKRIEKSVNEHGQRFNPILVNEKFEVVEGQGRLEVFHAKNMPIQYIVHDGLTLDDCVVFNSTNTSWTLQDYIDSFIAQGNENYIRLNNLIKAHKQIPINAVMFAVTGMTGGSKSEKSDIKGGKVVVTEADYLHAENLLSYADKFWANFTKGNRNYMAVAAMFAYSIDGIDREQLVDKWNKYGRIKRFDIPATTIYDACGVLEGVYNYNIKGKSAIYIQTEYDKYCRKQNAAYASRWASKREKTA